MESKGLRLIKLPKWRTKGFRKTFTLVKFGLIFVLCAIEFSISAQQTPLQIRISNKNNPGSDTIKIGTKTWFVVRKTAISGVNYAFLVSNSYISTSTPFSSGSNDYQGSNLQTILNNDYASSSADYSELKPIAVISKLGSFSSQTDTSEPSATLAGTNTTDVLFAPSYADVYNWCGSGTLTLGQPITTNYFERWWTRTAASDGQAWDVYPQGPVLQTNLVSPLTTINAVGAIWVRTTAIYYALSGMVNGLPNNEGIDIYYSINGVTQSLPVTTANGGYYSIDKIPSGSNVVIMPQTVQGYNVYVYPTPSTSNVTSDISKKNITYYIPGFSVNNTKYLDMDGKGYCDNLVSFSADLNIPAEIVWTLDGTEIPSTRSLFSFTRTLQDGYHTIIMTVPDLGETYTTHLYVGGLSVIWTPSAGTDDDKRNWNIAANWTPAVVPISCDTVYIPGNLAYYPMLEETNPAECGDIYFIYGAELGRPDLLTYQRAFVQYNFGLLESTPRTGTTLGSKSTDDRMTYSATVSAPHMARERWYMLSAPLKSVVTGDLDFGDFPLTFLRKFGPINKDNIHYNVGEWTTTYNAMNEPISPDGTDGFAFFMYGYLDGGSATRNLGCLESGVFGNYNEDDYMLDRNGKDYGIKKTNGILELPFFADPINLYAHRTQLYNEPTSTFYYVNDGVSFPADFNKLTGNTESVERKGNNENYRFVPESYDSNNTSTQDWIFENPIYHSVTNLNDGDEFLVGNPYMSSIDMVEFCIDNPSVYPSFRIWNADDHDFDDYSVNTSTGEVTPTNPGSSPYISPLQGFLLKYKGSGTVGFDVKKISTVRKTTAFNLRSAQGTGEENLLRIKAENNYAVSYAVIGYKETASNSYDPNEDVQKLFSPEDYVPSIYSLADEIPVGINFINNKGDISIPLGIKTGETGKIQLTFTGMDNYSKASGIKFLDALENQTIDLTGQSSYTYSFDNTNTGIQNGRFSLRIENLTTSLPDVDSSDDLKVYGDSKGIYVVSSESVQKLEIYDFTGRKLYETTLNAKYYPLHDNLSKYPLIVKVTTKNQAKTVKINCEL